MKITTIITIETILEADRTISKAKKEKVMDILLDRNPPAKLRLGTKKQVAEMLGCTTRTIDRYMETGRIIPLRYSDRLIRFDLDAIEAYARGEGVNK